MNLWIIPTVLCALVVGVILVGRFFAERRVSVLRTRGIYPEKGKEREEDVERLLRGGERTMAIRCYREIHRVGLKEAKDAIVLLEKKKD